MPLPPEGLETLREVAPHLAELAAGINDALEAEGVYDPDVDQAMLIRLCQGLYQNPHAGGIPLLDQLKHWYLQGALSQKVFSLLTVHVTILICA